MLSFGSPLRIGYRDSKDSIISTRHFRTEKMSYGLKALVKSALAHRVCELRELIEFNRSSKVSSIKMSSPNDERQSAISALWALTCRELP